MRILYVADIVNHHHMPLARRLLRAVGANSFRFATMRSQPDDDCITRGWRINEEEPWILRYEKETNQREFERWWAEADVVIAGHRIIPQLADRICRGKLTFYMSERWWKPPFGSARLIHPRFAWMAYRFCQLAKSPYFHYLPIGGYAAADMKRLAAFHKRLWNWGYFTSLAESCSPCVERNGVLRILWAGRMLSWKRVDTLVRAFALLRRSVADAHLMLIGNGPSREKLEQLTRRLNIDTHVDFRPGMPVAQVREQMRNAHVYVLPSNGYEGWGAVLNEAMAEGCAIVASAAAGAAKTILRHGENGLLFNPGDYRRLSDLLVQLTMDESFRRRLAESGRRSIMEMWSPEIAAERFLAVSDACLLNCPTPIYSSGPMSPAWLRWGDGP